MKIKLGELRAAIRESVMSINSQSKLVPAMAKFEDAIMNLEDEFMEYNLDNEAHIPTTVGDSPVGKYSDFELWEREVEMATRELRQEVENAIKKSQEKLYKNGYVQDIKADMMPQKRWQ